MKYIDEKEYILIRHGQTDYNSQERFQEELRSGSKRQNTGGSGAYWALGPLYLSKESRICAAKTG